MNVVERLGRRKEEARAGLDRARGKRPAPPPVDPEKLDARTRALLGTVSTFPEPDDFSYRLGALIDGIGQKLTFLPSPRLEPLAFFAQRLLDDLVAIAGEPAGAKSDYGTDRLFISFSLPDEAHDYAPLGAAGHPVLQWTVDDVAAEIVRWHVVALMLSQKKPPTDAGEPMPAEPALRAQNLALFSNQAKVLRSAAGIVGAQEKPAGWIAAHVALADPGDHAVLACWLPEDLPLSEIQGGIRSVTKLACTRMFEHVRQHPQATVLLLTAGDADVRAAFEKAPPLRMLRVHSEDGNFANIIETLKEAVKMLSRK